jgi:transglutaminase-like putative cysteine protease
MATESPTAMPLVAAPETARSARPRKSRVAPPPITLRRFRISALVLALAALPAARADFVAWITPFAALLMLLAFVRGPHRRRPPLTLLLLLSAVSFGATFLHYGTINGLRAGATLLLCLAGIKLLETRHERDLGTVLLLTLFLLATDLFFSQQLLTVIYVVAVFVAVLAAWIAGEEDTVRSGAGSLLNVLRSGLRPALGLLAWSLPWALLLFVFVPRIHGPLWGWGRRHAWVSGLSPSLELGGIDRLLLSRRTIMTVRFVSPRPPAARRYFRVYVFTSFNGTRWAPPVRAFEPAPPPRASAVRGPRLVYRVTLRPDDRRALAALGRPLTLPPGTWLSRAGTLRARRPLRRSFRYALTAVTGPRPAPRLGRRARIRTLELPADSDRKARRLARRWARSDSSPTALVSRALRYFHDRPFYYTLHPPPLHGRNAVDTFLFHTRRGFCTDYATAFAVLMRAAGVPTRVVTGYVGGRYDPLNGRVEFRGTDAHAWDEVWIDGAWRRVDPTAAIARSRISAHALRLLAGGYTVGGFDLGRSPWLARIGRFWRRVGVYWNRDILGYGPREQRTFLRRLGIKIRGWRSWLPVLAAVLVLPPLLLWAAVLLEGRRRRAHGDERAWRTLLRRLGRLYPPPAATGETALEYAARIVRVDPFLGWRFLALARRRGRVLYEPAAEAGDFRRYRRTLMLVKARLDKRSSRPKKSGPTPR